MWLDFEFQWLKGFYKADKLFKTLKLQSCHLYALYVFLYLLLNTITTYWNVPLALVFGLDLAG